MNIKNLPRGDKYPEEFNLVVEITKGSHNKYEYDEELDVIKLDRVYHSSLVPTTDYGFIPQTRSEDGDHLDALLLIGDSVTPGIMVEARPIGVLYMIDNGEKDEKIISVPVKDPRYSNIKDLSDLGPHFTKELQFYFEHYKILEGKKVEISGWGNKEEAIKVLNKSIE